MYEFQEEPDNLPKFNSYSFTGSRRYFDIKKIASTMAGAQVLVEIGPYP